MSSTAYRRKERGEGRAGQGDFAFCLGLWLVCAVGFAALARRAGDHAAQNQSDTTQSLPGLLENFAQAQSYLTEPRMLAACLLGLAGILLLRNARMESLIVASTFALFAAMATIKQVMFEMPPTFTRFGGYEDLFGSYYGFPSAQIVGLAVLGGLVFVFAEKLLTDVIDVWLLRLASLGVVACAGLLGYYQGAYTAIEVVANYLLVALFLIPIAGLYGRDVVDPRVVGSLRIDDKPVRHGPWGELLAHATPVRERDLSGTAARPSPS